jgi:FtsH-binding integral membrane protein
MASAVLLTGIVAMLFARSGMAADLFINGGLLKWLVILGPLGIVIWLNMGLERMSTGMAQTLFWAYAGTLGLSLSVIFLIYTGTSIATTFFSTALAFASLSLWGYTTKKDLSGWGSFLIMGVVGLVAAMVINIFLKSSTMQMTISAAGVLIFAGLTAYDTQYIKSMYFQVAGSDRAGKEVILGALKLYVDFINMFLFLLRLFGNRN